MNLSADLKEWKHPEGMREKYGLKTLGYLLKLSNGATFLFLSLADSKDLDSNAFSIHF